MEKNPDEEKKKCRIQSKINKWGKGQDSYWNQSQFNKPRRKLSGILQSSSSNFLKISFISNYLCFVDVQ